MNGVRNWNLIIFNLVAATFALSAVVGCSVDMQSKPLALPSKSSKVQTKTINDGDAKPAQPEQTPASEPTSVEPESLTMNLVDLSSGGRQRKSSLQLQKSFVACVGAQSEGDTGMADEANPSILQVSNEMIVSATATTKPKGRFGFLIYGNAAEVVGKSILDLEKLFIDVEGTSSGVKASSLEDELYLNSLQTIASVIAFNCDVESESSKCFCSTKAKAREMVERCLTLFDTASDEFTAAFEGFSEACSADASDEGLLKRRKAIVSLLSSYAFATSR
jgi:hypothetical protein